MTCTVYVYDGYNNPATYTITQEEKYDLIRELNSGKLFVLINDDYINAQTIVKID